MATGKSRWNCEVPSESNVSLSLKAQRYPIKVLSWRVSNSRDSRFYEEALKEALERYGAPVIFNTDQGGQFTSNTFTQILRDYGIRISMDG
jgi:putative transposase